MQDNAAVISDHTGPSDGRPASVEDQADLQRWIARELHDVVVQPLTNTLVELNIVGLTGTVTASERSEAMRRELRVALHGLRRLMGELRGEPVDSEGLVTAVTALLADLRVRTGLDANIQVSSGWPSQLTPETSRNLRRIIEEALRNVVSHSGASWVEVRLEHLDGALRVSITDNGVFGPETSGVAYDGMGTRGMRERAVVIGGVLTVDHAQTGSTIAVIVEDPLSDPRPPAVTSGRDGR